jgi:signal transduction histidine kinase
MIISNLVFELKLINKAWISVALQSKFILMWLLSKDFTSSLELEHHIVSLVCLLWGSMIATITEASIKKLISNLHQDHLSLYKAKNTLYSIISSIPEALIIIGYDFSIVFKNDVSLDLFQCNRSEELIQTLNSLCYKRGLRVYDPDISNENVMRDFQDYISSDRPQKIAFGIAPFKDKYLNIHGSKIDWDNQKAVIISARDITSQIIVDEYKTELVWKNMVLRSVSHEIRTPTTAIITFIDQVLKEESNLSSEGKKYMRTVSVCSKMLLHLVNDLLDYSQMLAGTFKVSKKFFELRPILTETFDLLTIQCEMKGIECKLTIDDLLPNKIYSDPNRLSQIILNLLTNALK